MKPIITPTEVIEMAFGTTHTLRTESIPTHTILAAQRRFVRPVVGEELYALIVAEEPEERVASFVAEYLKLPLALYVASLLLPSLAVQVGTAGVVRLSGESFEAADEGSLRRAVRRLRRDAEALLDAATDHLATAPSTFPEYHPEANIRQRVSIEGGLVVR